MIAWLLGGALLWGVGAARLLVGRSRTLWLLLAPGLAAAGGLAGWIFTGQAALAGVLLGLAGALALARGSAGGQPIRLRPAEGFPLLLLALAAWFYPVGAGQLAPDVGFLVQVAPWAAAGGGDAHPLGPAALPHDRLSPLLVCLGGDSFLVDRALAGLFQVLALLTLYVCLRSASGHWMAAFLGAGWIYSWGEPGWLLTTSTADAASHLLLAAGLGTRAVSEAPKARVQAALLLAAAAVLPSGAGFPLAGGSGFSALLALIGLEALRDRRWAAAGLLSWLALGAGLGFPLDPAAPPASLGVLALPLVAWWGRRQDPVVLLALAEPLSWLLGGTLAPGTAGAGAAGFFCGHWLGTRWQEAEPGRPQLQTRPEVCLVLPWRVLLAGLGLWLVLLGMEPGESEFNHRLLLAAQKRHVDLLELAAVRPLREWVPLLGSGLDLSQDDLELARALQEVDGTAVVLTPSKEVEPVQAAAALSALAGGRPIRGWYADPRAPELFPAPEVIRRTGELTLAGAAGIRVLVLRGPCTLKLPPEASTVLETAAGSRILEFPPAPPSPQPPPGRFHPLGPVAPGRLTEFSVARGDLSYRVTRDGRPWGEDLPVRDSRFVLPLTPGRYRLQVPGGASGPEMVSDLPAALAGLKAAAVDLPHELPSRSLVPVRIRLAHPGPGALDLGRFRGARLQAFVPRAGSEVSFEAPIEPLPARVLEAAEPMEIELTLATPEPEGGSPVTLELIDLEGRAHPVGWERSLIVRTWRRLPPVGSW